ncbi:RNA-directed DNA polymerase [bacterium]|nr:RNA-directed DNA polymerase [bacterium]
MTTLLEKVSDIDNLFHAYRDCARGKRQSSGYYKTLFSIGERLSIMSEQIASNKYKWRGYRHFYVVDPKRRLVMAAPFQDRIVHHAIHRHIEPILDTHLSDSVYACRHDRGNRFAVISLLEYIKELGPRRFCMKLDVEKCYESIHLKTLHSKVTSALPDRSLDKILWELIHNHPEYAARGYGIPIGNLTSQLFANYYMSGADTVVHSILKKGRLFRYMDDLVLVGPDKDEIMQASWAAVHHVQDELKMGIPFYKMVPLGDAPIPFLGFVVDHTGYRILARNRRRYSKKMTRLQKIKARPSLVAQVQQSFEAWKVLPKQAEVSVQVRRKIRPPKQVEFEYENRV